MGKPVIRLEARAAYPLIAPFYEAIANPLQALEARILARQVDDWRGKLVIDVASGTGRWASFAKLHGSRVVAVDLCHEMIARSGCGMRIQADMTALPLPDGFADVAICSMGLGYVPSAIDALQEMGRIARRVILSDMHPDAVRAGWVRSFPTARGTVEVRHFVHALEELELSGFQREWFIEQCFGPEDRDHFIAAGRADLYARALGIKAIGAASWIKM